MMYKLLLLDADGRIREMARLYPNDHIWKTVRDIQDLLKCLKEKDLLAFCTCDTQDNALSFARAIERMLRLRLNILLFEMDTLGFSKLARKEHAA